MAHGAADAAQTERALIRLAQLREKVWGCGFPPLPMMALNDEGEHAVASSFALLLAALQNMPPGFTAHQDPRAFAANQVAAVLEMHEGIAAIGLVEGDSLTVVALEQIYDVICACFRKYVSVLLGTTPGIRFVPVSDVAPDHRVVREGRQWLLESASEELPPHATYRTVLQTFTKVALESSDVVLHELRSMHDNILSTAQADS